MKGFSGLSEAEKEKGLDLHEKAIVVNAHDGFPGDMVPRRDQGEQKTMENVYLPYFQRGGLTGVCASLWADSNQPFTDAAKKAFRSLDCFYSELEESPHLISLATKVEDIKQAKREGKVAFLLKFQGGKPLEGDPRLLRTFYRLGVRMVQLTHNARNQIADGVGERRTKGGLTNFGAELVKEMDRLGMIVDLAHISESGFWDAIKLSKDVIVSHSAASVVHDNLRNINDEQLKALAEKDGVLGIGALPTFLKLGAVPTIDDFMDHIDHVVNTVGINHVGLGLDYITFRFEEIVESLKKRPDIYPGPFDYPTGLEDVGELSNLTMGLVGRGYSDKEIEKVLGGNWLRLFRRIIG